MSLSIWRRSQIIFSDSLTISVCPQERQFFPIQIFAKEIKTSVVCFHMYRRASEENAAAERVNASTGSAGKKDRTKSYYYQFSRSPYVYVHAGGGQQTLFHLHTIYLVFTTLYEVLMCLSNRSRQKVACALCIDVCAPMCWCRLLRLFDQQTNNKHLISCLANLCVLSYLIEKVLLSASLKRDQSEKTAV